MSGLLVLENALQCSSGPFIAVPTPLTDYYSNLLSIPERVLAGIVCLQKEAQ